MVSDMIYLNRYYNDCIQIYTIHNNCLNILKLFDTQLFYTPQAIAMTNGGVHHSGYHSIVVCTGLFTA